MAAEIWELNVYIPAGPAYKVDQSPPDGVETGGTETMTMP